MLKRLGSSGLRSGGDGCRPDCPGRGARGSQEVDGRRPAGGEARLLVGSESRAAQRWTDPPRGAKFFFGLSYQSVGGKRSHASTEVFAQRAAWDSGRLVGWSAGRLVGWSAGRLVGWSAGRLVGWSAGRLVEGKLTIR